VATTDQKQSTEKPTNESERKYKKLSPAEKRNVIREAWAHLELEAKVKAGSMEQPEPSKGGKITPRIRPTSFGNRTIQ
jgi:hypothetical protein